jgi:hypothetical protein
LPAQLHRQPAKLPPRMYHQFRVQLDDSLHQSEVCRPLSWSVRLQCQVSSGQPQSHLSVPSRIHRRPICSMRFETWVIFLYEIFITVFFNLAKLYREL